MKKGIVLIILLGLFACEEGDVSNASIKHEKKAEVAKLPFDVRDSVYNADLVTYSCPREFDFTKIIPESEFKGVHDQLYPIGFSADGKKYAFVHNKASSLAEPVYELVILDLKSNESYVKLKLNVVTDSRTFAEIWVDKQSAIESILTNYEILQNTFPGFSIGGIYNTEHGDLEAAVYVRKGSDSGPSAKTINSFEIRVMHSKSDKTKIFETVDYTKFNAFTGFRSKLQAFKIVGAIEGHRYFMVLYVYIVFDSELKVNKIFSTFKPCSINPNDYQ